MNSADVSDRMINKGAWVESIDRIESIECKARVWGFGLGHGRVMLNPKLRDEKHQKGPVRGSSERRKIVIGPRLGLRRRGRLPLLYAAAASKPWPKGILHSHTTTIYD
jgi:hypothetical protein